MKNSVEEIRKAALAELDSAVSSRALDEIRVKYLGRNGKVTLLLKEISKAPKDERPRFGQRVNQLKNEVSAAIDEKAGKLAAFEEEERLRSSELDVTLPGRRPLVGKKHIITQTMDELLDILADMGFSIEYGPEVESDFYNFEALNFPPDHPARDMQDTFFITDDLLLRTHTGHGEDEAAAQGSYAGKMLSQRGD